MSRRTGQWADLGLRIREQQAADLQRAGHLELARQRLLNQATNGLEGLGRMIRQQQARQLAEPSGLGAVRSHLLAPRRPRGRMRIWLSAGLAATATATALVIVLIRPGVAPIVTVNGRAVALGQWLAPTQAAELPLRFDDGSEVVLEPNASARVKRLDHQGADVDLRHGAARVHVVRRATKKHWSIFAGPFKVAVVGTLFRVAWLPAKDRFELSLRRGRVQVDGPGLHKQVIRAGQRVRVWVQQGRVEIQTAPRQRPVAMDADKNASLGQTRAAAPPKQSDVSITRYPTPPRQRRTHRTSRRRHPRRKAPTGSATTTAQTPRPTPAPWAYARQGKWHRAIEAAEAIGWAKVFDTANGQQLLALADAARLTGQHRLAQRIYQRVRRRFATSAAAATAAFFLGRQAFSDRRLSVAADWFRRYLSEAARGPLAREATGRLLECLVKLKQNHAASVVAGDYLRHYPRGPHARLARRIIKR